MNNEFDNEFDNEFNNDEYFSSSLDLSSDLISSTSLTINNSTGFTKKSNKKNGGRHFSSVWDHIVKGKEISRGHYEGTCSYCKTYWKIAKPVTMRAHLASHCSQCPESVAIEYAKIITEENIQEDHTFKYNNKCQKTTNSSSLPISTSTSTSSTSTSSISIPTSSIQSGIQQHFESTKITSSRQKDIDNALIKAFVCYNFAFAIIKNPFFIELLKTLCPGYKSPSRRKLSIELLENEVARVNLKIKYIFDNTTNLTLGMYIYIILLNYYLLLFL